MWHLWWFLILPMHGTLLLAIPSPQDTLPLATPMQGTLTLTVRDAAGQPVSDVPVALSHDADDG